jgi:hypothetical protein
MLGHRGPLRFGRPAWSRPAPRAAAAHNARVRALGQSNSTGSTSLIVGCRRDTVGVLECTLLAAAGWAQQAHGRTRRTSASPTLVVPRRRSRDGAAATAWRSPESALQADFDRRRTKRRGCGAQVPRTGARQEPCGRSKTYRIETLHHFRSEHDDTYLIRIGLSRPAQPCIRSTQGVQRHLSCEPSVPARRETGRHGAELAFSFDICGARRRSRRSVDDVVAAAPFQPVPEGDRSDGYNRNCQEHARNPV